MPDIKQITLPSGTTYDIKDQGARDLIEALGNYTVFLGVTSTALTDGSTTNPITIAGNSVTARTGDIVTYGSEEFIFNGTQWQAFGDLSGLGALAFKDTASGSGTVTVPKTYTTTVTPAAKEVSVTGTTTGSVSVTKSAVTVSKASSGTATYTPQGSNASSSVSGSCTVTASGTISKGTGTANYTPQGSNASSSVSGSCSVTATGSVAAPTISVKTAGATTNVTGITSVGSMPTYSVSNENLTITAGAAPTAATAVACKTGDAVYQATAPAFTGTAATGTISGTAAAQTFTGTGAELKFTGTSATGTISGTAAAQTFTGTGARLVTDSEVATGASFTGASMTSTGSYTPATPTASTTTATTESKTVNVTVS